MYSIIPTRFIYIYLYIYLILECILLLFVFQNLWAARPIEESYINRFLETLMVFLSCFFNPTTCKEVAQTTNIQFSAHVKSGTTGFHTTRDAVDFSAAIVSAVEPRTCERNTHIRRLHLKSNNLNLLDGSTTTCGSTLKEYYFAYLNCFDWL